MDKLSIKKWLIFSAMLVAVLLAMFPLKQHPTLFSYSASVVLITLLFWSTGFIPPFMAGLIFLPWPPFSS
ncbi:hypothetical protein N7V09_13710 [Shewanella seohaensis]|nr:hypothetical protein N7V09_13710 [Shewanella seohaensis]